MYDDAVDYFSKERLLIPVDENHMITDLLKGYVRLNSEIALLDTGNVVIRRDHLEMNKVKILSGSPAGYEPAYVGYVGKGFLTASVKGEIYSAPTSENVLTAIKELSRRNVNGILIIVGDTLNNRLNFGYAVEKALNIPNIKIKMLLISDGECGANEKRSCVGTVLIQKIAGAMSELGFSLDEIYDYCASLLDEIKTISVNIGSLKTDKKFYCSAANLTDKILEFGAGIYGEPPYLKMPITSIPKTVEIMLEQIKFPSTTNSINSEIPVLVLINNLGCTTKLEELIFTQEFLSKFEWNKYRIAKIFKGTYMTSLRSIGLSITLMKLDKPKVLDYISYPCNISFWKELIPLDPETELVLKTNYTEEEKPSHPRGPQLNQENAELIKTVILFACEAIMSCERQLNIMDSELGDADTGTNLRKACTFIIKEMQKSENFYYPFELFKEMAAILWKNNVGLSGSLFCLIFEKTADFFLNKSTDFIINSNVWLEVLKVAEHVILSNGKTHYGSKTMYDPIYSCIEKFDKGLNSGLTGIDAFELGVLAARDTVNLMTQFKGIYSDPGAHAVSILLRAIYDVLITNEKRQDTCKNTN